MWHLQQQVMLTTTCHHWFSPTWTSQRAQTLPGVSLWQTVSASHFHITSRTYPLSPSTLTTSCWMSTWEQLQVVSTMGSSGGVRSEARKKGRGTVFTQLALWLFHGVKLCGRGAGQCLCVSVFACRCPRRETWLSFKMRTLGIPAHTWCLTARTSVSEGEVS